jgi:hypothetical protein
MAAKYANNPLLPPSVAALISSAAAGIPPSVAMMGTTSAALSSQTTAMSSQAPALNLALPPAPVMTPAIVPPHLPRNLTAMDLKNLSIMSRLYVGALTYDVTDVIVCELFSQCGAVKGERGRLDCLFCCCCYCLMRGGFRWA